MVERPIAGIRGAGKGEVGQGVFVAAEHLGVLRQRRQALQGGVHHGRVALEDAPATTGEQGIAAKQQGIRVLGVAGVKIGDVIQGMPRHGQYFEIVGSDALLLSTA